MVVHDSDILIPMDESSLTDRRSLTLLDSLSITHLGSILVGTALMFVALLSFGAALVPSPRVSTELAADFPLGLHAKDNVRKSGVLEKELHFNWQQSQQFDLNLQLKHTAGKKKGAVENAMYEGIAGPMTPIQSVMVVMKAELSGITETGLLESMGGPKTFSRHVQCAVDSDHCEPITLVQEEVLRYKAYKITIQMLSDVQDLPLIATMSSKGILEEDQHPLNDLAVGTFSLRHKSMKYVQFQLIVKYSAVGFTCVLFLYFLYSTRALSPHEYNVETKWLPFLHVGLLCFNDPLFGISFMMHTWYVTFFSELFQTAFWAILLLFWLSVLDSMVAEASQRTFELMHLPKIVFAVIFWLLLSFSHGWVAWHHMDSPYYSEAEEVAVEAIRDDAGVGVYGIVEYTLLVAVSIYCVWVLVLMTQAASTFKTMDHRLRLLCLFTCGMIVATLSAFFNFWVLHQDSHHEKNEPMRFVVFSSLFNVYIGLLTFLCTPSEGSTKLK